MGYILLLIPAVLSAQESRGRILGRVADGSGAVVANASVRVTNTETKVATDTKS